jgi:hypothetical protein
MSNRQFGTRAVHTLQLQYVRTLTIVDAQRLPQLPASFALKMQLAVGMQGLATRWAGGVSPFGRQFAGLNAFCIHGHKLPLVDDLSGKSLCTEQANLHQRR